MSNPSASSYGTPRMRQPSSAVSSSASMPSENGQIASARLRHSRPSDDRSQTVAHDTTGPQHADRRPSRLFSSGVVDHSHTAALKRLEIQLHDVTTAFATSDINHSANIMQTMGKLGDIIRTYGRDNHIAGNMGKVIDYMEFLSGAERAARALLHGLEDLSVPPNNMTEGAPTTSPSRSQAMASEAIPPHVPSARQPAKTADHQRNVPETPSVNSSRAESASRAKPTKSSSWPATTAASVIPPLLATFTDLAVTGQVLRREQEAPDDPSSRSAAVRIERAKVIDSLIDTTAYNTDLSKDDDLLQLCKDLEQCSDVALSNLLVVGTNLYESSDVFDIFHSTVCRHADVLYEVVAAAATIASAVAQNMDSSTAAVVLGSVGGALKAGADLLARTTVGPSPTNTLSAVANALHTIDDLVYAAELMLLSYIELQSIVRIILALRQEGNAFCPKDKARIAQFFYSFGRHFDTATGNSIELVSEEERRKLENTRKIHRGAVAGAYQATNARDPHQGSGLPMYHRDGQVATSGDLRHR